MKPYDYARWDEPRRYDPVLDLAIAGLSLWMRTLDAVLLSPVVFLKKRSKK